MSPVQIFFMIVGLVGIGLLIKDFVVFVPYSSRKKKEEEPPVEPAHSNKEEAIKLIRMANTMKIDVTLDQATCDCDSQHDVNFNKCLEFVVVRCVECNATVECHWDKVTLTIYSDSAAPPKPKPSHLRLVK